MDSEEAFIEYVNENPGYSYFDVWLAAIEFCKKNEAEEKLLVADTPDKFYFDLSDQDNNPVG